MTAPLDFIRAYASTVPPLAKFAVLMAIIVGIPPLSRRLRLPSVVGFLLCGVVIGPHGLGLAGDHRPIVDFAAELGKLLLMFFCGLEINLALFRRTQSRSITFGLCTTLIPLLLGTTVGLLFGYAAIPAIVLGSLLASHTLLASPIVAKLGLTKLEPITITVGATVFSDTLSLVVFAICVSSYKKVREECKLHSTRRQAEEGIYEDSNSQRVGIAAHGCCGVCAEGERRLRPLRAICDVQDLHVDIWNGGAGSVYPRPDPRCG